MVSTTQWLWFCVFAIPLDSVHSAVAALHEVHSFGHTLATGSCKLTGLPPIVSFPRWGTLTPDQPEIALGIVTTTEGLQPFKIDGVTSIKQSPMPDPSRDLVSVQALHCVGDSRTMWVLDSGHAPMDKLPKDAAKLLQVSVAADGVSGRVERRWTFSKDVANENSYLNDVRVDTRGFAYITDSNEGSIVVLELSSGKAQVWSDERMQPFLAAGEKFEVEGVDLQAMMVAVDGIAFSRKDDLLFFKPVTRSSLYSVPAELLRKAIQAGDGDFSAASAAVRDLGRHGFHDGIDADCDGVVYLTDLSNGVIQRRSAMGELSAITPQGALPWPDSVTVNSVEHTAWVLTTQVHLMPFLHDGKDRREVGNKLYRIDLNGSGAPPMGRLEAALTGSSGFPSRMPAIPHMNVTTKLATAARILDRVGYSLDVAGHITVAKSGGAMWSTPYGMRWEELEAEDILVVDGNGDVLEGRWDVTPAINIHTELHTSRADAKVVIHNHPPYGSLLAAMHIKPGISEQQACMFDGDIALVEEYTGGVDSPALGRQLSDRIGNATAIILANHGVLVTGESIEQATYRAVVFERTCRLHYEILAANQKPVPVPMETRKLLKKSLNTLSVDNYWRGEVRRLGRNGALPGSKGTQATCSSTSGNMS